MAAVDAQREIEELVAFEGRLAGSEAERRAAEHLAERLRALGREVDTEPIAVHPNWALTHALHALLAVVGSLVSVAFPLVGIVILAAVTLSALGDLTGTLFLLRRLTGRRASQNVVSREDGGKAGALVLVAHYDTARAGAIFGPKLLERRATLAKRLRLPVGLGGGFLIAIVVVLFCTVVRGLGVESTLLSVVQFIPTVLLVIAIPLLLDIQLSGAVPGAADNASGVATVLALAERYGGALEKLDLWVLFTGAGEGLALGMREWLKAHRTELPRERTVFLCVDKVGNGTVRYTTKEGFLLAASYDPRLVEACEEIADEDDDGRFGARGIVTRETSDAQPARARGHPALKISCLGTLDYQPNYHQPTDTPDRVDPEALQRAFDFGSALIERLDERLAPDLDSLAEAAERDRADGNTPEE